MIYLIKKQDCIIEIHNNHVQENCAWLFFVIFGIKNRRNKGFVSPVLKVELAELYSFNKRKTVSFSSG